MPSVAFNNCTFHLHVSGTPAAVLPDGEMCALEDLTDFFPETMELCSKLQKVPADAVLPGLGLEETLGSGAKLMIDHMYVKVNAGEVITEMTCTGLVTTRFRPSGPEKENPVVPGEEKQMVFKISETPERLSLRQIIESASESFGQFNALENNCGHYAARVVRAVGEDPSPVFRRGGMSSVIARNVDVIHKLLKEGHRPLVQFLMDHEEAWGMIDGNPMLSEELAFSLHFRARSAILAHAADVFWSEAPVGKEPDEQAKQQKQEVMNAVTKYTECTIL